MIMVFKRWRQRAGVVILVMSLMAAVAWGRSYFLEDHIWIVIGKQRALALHTAIDHFALSSEWQPEHDRKVETPSGITVFEVRFNSSNRFDWDVYPVEDQFAHDPWGVANWYWTWNGMGFGESNYGTLGFQLLSVPYWTLVLGMSLLSAYLMFWKPN